MKDTSDKSARPMTAGAALFPALGRLGVDYVFVNSGTDFPPIIEGLASVSASDGPIPEAVVIPHEHAAMGMAHGFWLATGRAQAVMLHTNVGLANGVIGAINAACEHVPIYMMSGRTPVTEHSRFGARTVPIAWGQEMADQAGMIRESVKWEYELRFPEQVGEVVARMGAIANSTPKGPVYLSLPREVLCQEMPDGTEELPRMAPHRGAPDPDAVARAARMIAGARRPLVIAQRGAGSPETFATFADWARDWGIAVSQWWATRLAISTEHPCHIGVNPKRYLEEADVIVVLDCIAPWWPDEHPIREDARVINIGPDPLFSRTPIRNFRSDVSIAGETDLTLPALIKTMKRLSRNESAIRARRIHVQEHADGTRKAMRWFAAARNAIGITKEWAGVTLGEALAGQDARVFSELGVPLAMLRRENHGSWFQEPHSGGLGWSFPAALGAQLAEPDRLIVATMGDGSYMFANPTVCHQIAEAMGLPLLVIVLNNAEWGAVRKSVTELYPDGAASHANRMPLTSLQPSPDFRKVAEASRAWTARVERADDLRTVLDEAISIVREERRQALVEIATLPTL